MCCCSTPLSIGWALNKGFQTLCLNTVLESAHDEWNVFCLLVMYSFFFSLFISVLVRGLAWINKYSVRKKANLKQELREQLTLEIDTLRSSWITDGKAAKLVDAADLRFDSFDVLGDQSSDEALNHVDTGLRLYTEAIKVESDKKKDADGVSIELGSLISESDKTSLSIRLVTWRMEVNDFFSKSLGFVFAWTWNYVLLYLWFVNIFTCGTAKAINPGKECTPGSNYMLAIVASILMWQYLPALKMYVVNANSAQVRTKCTECQGEEPQVKQCKECEGTGNEKGLDSHEVCLACYYCNI